MTIGSLHICLAKIVWRHVNAKDGIKLDLHIQFRYRIHITSRTHFQVFANLFKTKSLVPAIWLVSQFGKTWRRAKLLISKGYLSGMEHTLHLQMAISDYFYRCMIWISIYSLWHEWGLRGFDNYNTVLLSLSRYLK